MKSADLEPSELSMTISRPTNPE